MVVYASFGVVLAAVYMLSVCREMFFGPHENKKNMRLNDMNTRETLAVAPLIALYLRYRLVPNLFLSRMSDGGRRAWVEHSASAAGPSRPSARTRGPVLLARRGDPSNAATPKLPEIAKPQPRPASRP